MTIWDCPHCRKEYEYSDNPDVVEGIANGKTDFECDCGCRFQMWVDWDPVFTVDRQSAVIGHVRDYVP